MEKVKKDNPMQLLRARLGLTCSQMAKDTDYSVHSVRNMLGDKGSTENFIRKVCEVYHVDERYFRGEISLDEAVESGFSP
nr:helix-turn-helix domain-containing protein [Oscillospiraceae bacterium]